MPAPPPALPAPDCHEVARLGHHAQLAGSRELATALYVVAALDRIGELARLTGWAEASAWSSYGAQLGAESIARGRARRPIRCHDDDDDDDEGGREVAP